MGKPILYSILQVHEAANFIAENNKVNLSADTVFKSILNQMKASGNAGVDSVENLGYRINFDETSHCIIAEVSVNPSLGKDTILDGELRDGK